MTGIHWGAQYVHVGGDCLLNEGDRLCKRASSSAIRQLHAEPPQIDRRGIGVRQSNLEIPLILERRLLVHCPRGSIDLEAFPRRRMLVRMRQGSGQWWLVRVVEVSAGAVVSRRSSRRMSYCE